MKSKYRYYAAAAAVVLVLLLCACASSAPRQTAEDPNFLGDFNPVQLENGMALTKMFGTIKPKELEIYLIPRTNIVEVYFRDIANKICILLERQQRDALQKAALQFLEGAEQGTIPDSSPSSKNAYAEMKCSLAWGVTGVSRVTEKASIQFNHEYIDGKPYFLIRMIPGPDKTDSDVYSPKADVYFSPAQLKAFCAATDQAALQSIVDELESKAYEY